MASNYNIPEPRAGFETWLHEKAPEVDRGYVEQHDEEKIFGRPLHLNNGLDAKWLGDCMLRTFEKEYLNIQKHPILVKLYAKGPATDAETHMFIRIEKSGYKYKVRYGGEEYLPYKHTAVEMSRMELFSALTLILWPMLCNEN